MCFGALNRSGLNRGRRGTNPCDVSRRLRLSHKTPLLGPQRTSSQRGRERELPQISGTHSHIYNYNARSWRVSPEDTHGSTKRPHTHTEQAHTHTYTVCSLLHTHTHTHKGRLRVKITHRNSVRSQYCRWSGKWNSVWTAVTTSFISHLLFQ